jgi:hypothetical protein
MGRIKVPGQPEQKCFQDTTSTEKKLDVLVYVCHPSHGRKHKIEGSQASWPGHKQASSLKQPEQKGLEVWLKWSSPYQVNPLGSTNRGKKKDT